MGYHKECDMEQKTLSEMIEVADFAETIEKLAVLRSFQNPEVLIRRCFSFLRQTLRTRVIDFSGLKFSPQQVSTVEMLHEGIMQLPLSVVCQGCKKFVIGMNHKCALRKRFYPRLYH